MLKNAFKISLNQPQKWKKPFKTYNNKLSMHLSKLPNKKSFLITWKKRLFKTRLINLKGRHPFNLRKFLFLRISNKSTLFRKNSLALCSQHLRN